MKKFASLSQPRHSALFATVIFAAPLSNVHDAWADGNSSRSHGSKLRTAFAARSGATRVIIRALTTALQPPLTLYRAARLRGTRGGIGIRAPD